LGKRKTKLKLGVIYAIFFGQMLATPGIDALNKENETLPAGLSNAYLFAMFNALSFQIVLNSPMVLYAKSLGASATILEWWLA